MEPLLREVPTGHTIGDPETGIPPHAIKIARLERPAGADPGGLEHDGTREPTMKMIFIAGIMITLPAIVIMFAFFGRSAMYPALASFGVNMLPFLAVMYLLRGRKGKEDGDDFGH